MFHRKKEPLTYYDFVPQLNITAYELAQLMVFIHTYNDRCQIVCDHKHSMMLDNNLDIRRHFKKVGGK